MTGALEEKRKGLSKGSPALGRRRLFLRVYLHGVVLLLASAATFAIVGHLFVRARLDAGGHRFSDFVAAEVCDASKVGEHELGKTLARAPVEVSLYNADRSLLASTVSPPLPPPDPGRPILRIGAARPPEAHAPFGFACPAITGAGASGAAIVVTGHQPPLRFPLGRIALELALVLVILALGSMPLARSIVRPLERLLTTARALGEGNLTARANLERKDEIGDLSRAFDEMAARLEGMLRAEKELLANVSHELRTPMARIRVVLEATEEDPLLAQRYLPEIAIDLAELERLVEDVMTAARFDLAGDGGGEVSLPLRPEWVAPSAILKRSIGRFEEIHRGRTLRVDASDALPSLYVDPQLVRRAVDNLLDNAAKYSDSATAIDLRVEHRETTVWFEVIDRGIGIDEKDKDAVFSPFFRTDRSRSRMTGGVGLGLTLARRIVEGHGGTLALDSKVGEGTTVGFGLPVAKPDGGG